MGGATRYTGSGDICLDMRSSSSDKNIQNLRCPNESGSLPDTSTTGGLVSPGASNSCNIMLNNKGDHR